jgi:hypothetical protein
MLTKKERLKLDREHESLMKNLAGIKDMNGLPDMLFIIDVRKEDIAVKEANRLGIPIVAVVDTNCSPEGISQVIPGNDDALRAIRLFASRIADAILEGQQIGTEGGVAAAAANGAASEEGAGEPVETATAPTSVVPKEFRDPDDGDEEETDADITVADQTWETAEETHTDSTAAGAFPEQGADHEASVRPEISKMASDDIRQAQESQTEESNEATAS